MTLRALVVDDSLIFRKVVRDCIAELPGVEVIDVAKDGIAAISKIKQLKPDVVTLDVEMPGMNGLQVLEELQREGISTKVIMVSSHTQAGARTTTKALAIGAFDFILKPCHDSARENYRELREQIGIRIQAIRRSQERSVPAIRSSPPEVRVKTVPSTRPTKNATSKSNRRLPGDLDAICIGISTGGPKALAKLIPALPPSTDVPIFIVQHMPPVFTATLAKGLDEQSSLNVVEAEHGTPIKGGTVYIAPGGKQMRIDGYPGAWRIEITDDPAVRSCKPSVDYLFRSASEQFRDRMLAIVMTGMGSDGLEGCQEVANRGGQIWAQSESTCTVYGMPRVIIEAGLADEICSLDEITQNLISASRKSKVGCR